MRFEAICAALVAAIVVMLVTRPAMADENGGMSGVVMGNLTRVGQDVPIQGVTVRAVPDSDLDRIARLPDWQSAWDAAFGSTPYVAQTDRNGFFCFLSIPAGGYSLELDPPKSALAFAEFTMVYDEVKPGEGHYTVLALCPARMFCDPPYSVRRRGLVDPDLIEDVYDIR